MDKILAYYILNFDADHYQMHGLQFLQTQLHMFTYYWYHVRNSVNQISVTL